MRLDLLTSIFTSGVSFAAVLASGSKLDQLANHTCSTDITTFWKNIYIYINLLWKEKLIEKKEWRAILPNSFWWCCDLDKWQTISHQCTKSEPCTRCHDNPHLNTFLLTQMYECLNHSYRNNLPTRADGLWWVVFDVISDNSQYKYFPWLIHKDP